MIYSTFLLLLYLPLLPTIVINFHHKIADEDDENFFRPIKTVYLGPSGGLLVSGRGNFRPGFLPTISNSRLYLFEPLFAFEVRNF
uniref:Uncharacterized protein n=1 Tax=Onchocerca volvulus TaxID=6282 RepID=A0A8R1XJT7_ONCVO